MRFIVGTAGGPQSVFGVEGSKAVNLSAAVGAIGSDLSALAADPALLARARDAMAAGGEIVEVSSITPALPITAPGTFICLGLNYVEHIKEGGYEIPDYPALFMRGRNSLMAAGAPMVRPACSERLDYEAELLLIIGKGGRHISRENALDHVFGYTVFNDGSVRDYQRKTHQWTPGKNFDSTGAVGPFVVTPDELPEGAKGLKIESRVGDEILQSSNTANMIWSVADTIAIISEYTTLEPGDHIALGTPPGVGHAKKPNPRWLRPGETVEIEIEGIGVCASPVIDEVALSNEAAE
ncbi:Ureidoglycolate lyase [Pseudoruegeria aquimaris]|uniref:Ureidoglycolate lyase n=1 Tax=Pseudoruegeria aquimaris TaxID=393663 RepID=A0A1Y5SXH0_9RHOB|nr:fumarylacetoacetate hydrolase family protein [Pseudoruegeria aquimaris]SLN50372.1 Ureidoglycolate lyase [Pseudoruegeria aquimaris]